MNKPIVIDEELHTELKIYTAQHKRNMKDFVEELIKEKIQPEPK